MTAPCILRLDREIAAASSSSEKAILISEKACYLARIGDLDGAELYRSELRSQFGDGRDLRVSVRIMILEAVICYFRDFGAAAGDRLARANLLSTAAGDRELIALTCAWSSHIQFYEGKYSEAVNSAKRCMDNIRSEDWACLVRIGLFFGDMHLLTASHKASQEWYELARTAAVSYGDQAAVGAVIYNRASLKIFNLRVSRALGCELSEADIKLAEAECRSAVNYQKAAGVGSLEHLLIASQISLRIIRRDYSDALILLQQVLPANVIPGDYPYRAVILSDLILCHAALRNPTAAATALANLISDGLESLPIDDRLVVDWTLAEAVNLTPSLLTDYTKNIDLETARRNFNSQRQRKIDLLAPYLHVEDRFKSKK